MDLRDSQRPFDLVVHIGLQNQEVQSTDVNSHPWGLQPAPFNALTEVFSGQGDLLWVEPPTAMATMETIFRCTAYISGPVATVLQSLFQDNWLFLYLQTSPKLTHPCYQGTYNLACNGEIEEEAWALPTSICKSLWSQNIYLFSPLNMSSRG